MGVDSQWSTWKRMHEALRKRSNCQIPILESLVLTVTSFRVGIHGRWPYIQSRLLLHKGCIDFQHGVGYNVYKCPKAKHMHEVTEVRLEELKFAITYISCLKIKMTPVRVLLFVSIFDLFKSDQVR